jgi:hypothetical protein
MAPSSTPLDVSKKNKGKGKTVSSNDTSEESSASKGSSRGKNWSERDSLLLLEAYLHVEGKKRRTNVYLQNGTNRNSQ